MPRLMYAEPQPDILQLANLPRRIQRIIALLVRDAQVISACDIGSVEYHWHKQNQHESIKPKLVLSLPGEGCPHD